MLLIQDDRDTFYARDDHGSSVGKVRSSTIPVSEGVTNNEQSGRKAKCMGRRDRLPNKGLRGGDQQRAKWKDAQV